MAAAELDRRRDPEGEDVRSASVGQFTAVYWISRSAGSLYIVDVVWLGWVRTSAVAAGC
jgi:hypothetical protein